MPRTTAWTALICCLLLWLPSLQAIDNIDLQIGQWSFEDYAAEQFDLSVELSQSGLRLKATANTLSLPAPLGTVQDVQVNCDGLQLRSGTWQCPSGQLMFNHDRLGQQKIAFSLEAMPEQQHYQLDIDGLDFAAARIKLNASYRPAGWQLMVSADAISLTALSEWLPDVLSEAQLASLSEWEYQGLVDFHAELSGKLEQIEKVQLDWQASELGFTNQSGSQIAENVTLQGQLDARLNQQTWEWQVTTQADEGQAYSDPVFLDLKQHPLSVSATGALTADFNRVNIDNFQLQQQSVIAADASLTWTQSGIESLKLKTGPAELTTLYAIWLQPFALGTAAAKLQATGKVAIELDWRQGDYELQLGFEQVSLDDEAGRFRLQDLSGEFGWSSTDTGLETVLQWSQAKLYAVDLGGAGIKAESVNNSLALTEVLKLPVLDGSLQIDAFKLTQTEAGHVDWSFEGLLTPISMESLSEALDWPTLHGKLSGVIPKVSYSQQELRIDGALLVKVFDGTTVIRDLRMSSPFGSLPQLYANIDINQLDLALLTTAFDFGRITGRVEGYVRDMRLSNWEPVRFDARLATAQQNAGKRRISQKAVDNLTQIGGGASGMLSRSFLRFFEDFSYQKLGLACRLQNGVCQMSGIEEADQGYYIVKGGGGLPPWINVVGYTRRVDWADLVARLLAVRDSSGPVIE